MYFVIVYIIRMGSTSNQEVLMERGFQVLARGLHVLAQLLSTVTVLFLFFHFFCIFRPFVLCLFFVFPVAITRIVFG
jgi:hypothetical protein